MFDQVSGIVFVLRDRGSSGRRWCRRRPDSGRKDCSVMQVGGVLLQVEDPAVQCARPDIIRGRPPAIWLSAMTESNVGLKVPEGLTTSERRCHAQLCKCDWKFLPFRSPQRHFLFTSEPQIGNFGLASSVRQRQLQPRQNACLDALSAHKFKPPHNPNLH